MVVMTVIIVAVVVVGRRRMSVKSMGVAMRVVVVVDGIAARATRMRTDQRDDACKDGAQQRQEYDCLYHLPD
ncbi:membrane protein involved in colicin uptake [Bradyrhizobium embrapense]